ncbi:acyltransferase family protein [Aminipila butyrica]|uniref:Acyltransferase family protein n=1 Tax=Aminipila butyrica TaxID=433296 RepID=A0A858BU63_9FIRM|nr:acyltransferase family protein [Aminipila butyrica]QIB69571.1 acyltransferase family protein [Aminipila butyrica]
MENTVSIGAPQTAKVRSYIFDNLRGLAIWCIPISHFTRVGGEFSQGSLSGIVYITINVFVMQLFMFLSGYFSKKVDRARESAFQTFLLPYLFFTLIFYIFRYLYFGHANLDFLKPPFALWFLFSVFFYRYYLKDLVKIKHLLAISIGIYLIAGLLPVDTDYFALGRTISYFPFFLMGYYCTSDRLKSLQKLKKWQSIPLLVLLLGASYGLAFYVKVPVAFYLLKTTAADIGIPWYTDIILRGVVLILAVLWTIVLLNLMPNKKNYLSYIGMNTMPIYIFHLFFRYVVQDVGFPCPNLTVYYLWVFGAASLCAVVFSSPPVAKVYDATLDQLYAGWLKLKKKMIYEQES